MRRHAFSIALLLSMGPLEGNAQLLSPGRLAAAHGDLEGIRGCTSCHELGKRGVSAERCLDCHEAIAIRVEEHSGYHASVETNDCASCHQDHLGEDFDLLRLDEDAFEHTSAGYELEAGHAGVECRSCHEPSNVTDAFVTSFKGRRGSLATTYLGLSADCTVCHEREDPHGAQFPDRSCRECHQATSWNEPGPFDHATTAFALQGRHAQVDCAGCHGQDPVRAGFRPLAFGSCGDCHTDPHGDAMSGRCAGCHEPTGWGLSGWDAGDGGFDHAKTAFVLLGAHEATDCSACHRTGSPPSDELVRIRYRVGSEGRAYPRPVADRCASCHVDRHAFPDGAGRWTACANCHSEAGWRPTSFGHSRHGDASRFPLTGAHVATPCVACHEDPGAGHERFTLALPGLACADCHAAADPHADRYAGLACATCHATTAFDQVSFDHGTSAEARAGCTSCHAPDDPHGGQFDGRDCSSCHTTDRFAVESFEHETTRFPLDGAHVRVDCRGCHVADADTRVAVVRYRPLGTECTDCHGARP